MSVDPTQVKRRIELILKAGHTSSYQAAPYSFGDTMLDNRKLHPAKFIATLAFAAFTISAPALAEDGDATKGEKVFKKCASCHAVGEGAKNKVGPILTDVVGRTAGTAADFKYGKSIVAAGEAGLVWNADEIFAYLENPKKYLRVKLDDKKAKGKMSFKLKKEQDRRDVIAYLTTFSKAE